MREQDVVIRINAAEQVAFTLPDDVVKQADEKARLRQTSRAEVIRDALIKGIQILGEGLDNPPARRPG